MLQWCLGVVAAAIVAVAGLIAAELPPHPAGWSLEVSCGSFELNASGSGVELKF